MAITLLRGLKRQPMLHHRHWAPLTLPVVVAVQVQQGLRSEFALHQRLVRRWWRLAVHACSARSRPSSWLACCFGPGRLDQVVLRPSSFTAVDHLAAAFALGSWEAAVQDSVMALLGTGPWPDQTPEANHGSCLAHLHLSYEHAAYRQTCSS